MLGQPKYSYGDIIKVQFGDEEITGAVAIIDKYGTFFDDSDVSYDILNKEENILYKHINEKYVVEKIGEIPEEEVWKSL